MRTLRIRPIAHFSLLALLTLSLFSCSVRPGAAQDPPFKRETDTVYGRKYGTALTMDVFTPTANANGVGVIWVVSGGWYSSHDGIVPQSPGSPIGELIKRGYTVFAVVHGSQPKYTIPEVLGDMHRAVRYIRFHAVDYKIDPQRMGITGASAGGHLSLMQGTAGTMGDPNAKDPVERVSSRVQAVACYFPPTDFLNYGKAGQVAVGGGILVNFRPPFDFHEQDPKQGGLFVKITDPARIQAIGKEISPISHVTPDDPPTRLIHGDADTLVPIQQSEIMIAKLKESGVPAELIVKKGGGHGWADVGGDMTKIVDWFDTYLKRK
ncbi:MAG: alpha/beta hydrolase [Armatimonadota bacterium]